MSEVIVSYPVPYTCQFASPALVAAFVHGERPIESDPSWASYGARSPEEYAHWALRSCGVVCVKMAVEGLSGRSHGTVMDWVGAGLELDGYLRERRRERPVEKGWKHAALAELARRRGYHAELAADLTLSDLSGHIRADRLIIASVSSELGEDAPLTRRAGHLILLYGYHTDRFGLITHLIAHNPSGRTEALRQGARIPAARFEQGFSGRGIVVGRRDNRDIA